MGPRPRLKLLPFVHGYVDRHGRGRFYFRHRGYPTAAPPGLPWSPEFMAAHAAALAGEKLAPAAIGARRTLPGSFNAELVN